MSYSKDELVPPAWIDSAYLQKVLEHDIKDGVSIRDFTICPAATASDHFASLIFRVKIFYSTNAAPDTKTYISIIIKTLPTEDGLKKDIVDSYDIFGLEGAVFSKVLPVCHDMLRGVGIDELIGARMLYASAEPVKNIVLQDLKELGLRLPPTNYPSSDYYEAMFSKLALLHATTFKMHADGDTHISSFKGVFLNMSDIDEVFLFANGKDLLVEAIEPIPEFEEYTNKLKSMSTRALLDKCVEVVNEPGSYNVLNHGDLYTKNTMMNSTDGETDVVFVDFQLCHWGSPAVDIMYIAGGIPVNDRKRIIKHYFHVFVDTLEKLGYQGEMPTYDQLQEDMKRRRCLELYILVVSGPFLYVDESYTGTEEMDINTFMANRDFILKSFKDERFLALIKELLPLYLEKGYFDLR